MGVVAHEAFRARVAQVITRSGMTPAAFARAAGIDRSTLSQLLSGAVPRLPRAETLAAIARAAHVSVDWLLGLSQRAEVGAEIIEAVLQVEPYASIPAGDAFLGWLRAAQGSRVCTVPTGIPDFLKTDAILEAEYPPTAQRKAGAAAASVRRRMELMQHPEHQLEICVAAEVLTDFTLGLGRWARLAPALRRAQPLHMADVGDRVYPALRIHVHAGDTTYAPGFTVFGMQRVAVFTGTSWLVLNSAQHIQMFLQRFSDLVRAASVQPHAFVRHVRDLAATIE